MSYIEPVSLPSGAGIDYGSGDVRHFSDGDSISVPGIANPTRHLAARDNLLARKVNQLIQEVNNKEQIIPLPVYRLVVTPSTEEVIANHRIPSGYEARVLNAAVSSTPTSADIELSVLWAEGFGNTSGSAVMTTTSESSGGTTFSPAGEFIVQVKNKGGTTLDIVASIMVTMRPITDTSGALLPTATVVSAGPAGPRGEAGAKGATGSAGPAGSSGLNWRGQWRRTAYPVTYNSNDIVSHDFAGTNQRSSFVCLQTHIADGVNEPQPSLVPTPFWDILAEAGASGSEGESGGTGSSVAFSSASIQGTIATGSTFVAGTWNTSYNNGNIDSANRVFKVPMLELTALNPSGSPAGLATLNGDFRLSFYGDLEVTLPSTTYNNAAVNYASDSIRLIAVPHGTEAAGIWVAPEITPVADGWHVTVRGSTAIPMQLSLVGSQIIV